MPTTAALTRLRVGIQLLPSFLFLSKANLFGHPRREPSSADLRKKWKNRQKDIDPLVTTGQLDQQDHRPDLSLE